MKEIFMKQLEENLENNIEYLTIQCPNCNKYYLLDSNDKLECQNCGRKFTIVKESLIYE